MWKQGPTDSLGREARSLNSVMPLWFWKLIFYPYKFELLTICVVLYILCIKHFIYKGNFIYIFYEHTFLTPFVESIEAWLQLLVLLPPSTFIFGGGGGALLWFELRASHLLGRHFYCLSHASSPFCCGYFGVCPRASLKLQSSKTQSSKSLGLQVWATSTWLASTVLCGFLHELILRYLFLSLCRRYLLAWNTGF
jgi:hypothetical protein